MASYLSSWLPFGGSTATAPPPPPPPPSAPAAAPSPPPAPPAEEIPATPTTPAMSQTKRIFRQVSLPILGSAFLLLSMRAARRASIRRIKATIPPYYHPNNVAPTIPPNGAMDAVEALQLATLNVFSVAMIMVGGGAFAMDVSSLEELRAKFKVSDMGEEWEGQKKAAEEEFEEWVVSVLARKELKDRVKTDVEREIMEQEENKIRKG